MAARTRSPAPAAPGSRPPAPAARTGTPDPAVHPLPLAGRRAPLGLDPLRERRHAEPVGQLDHRLDHATGVAVAIDVVDERAIDLQDVDRQVLQPCERRVARSEVVDREGRDPRHGGPRAPAASDRGRPSPSTPVISTITSCGSTSGGAQLLHELLRQVARPELPGREVESEPDVDALRLPGLALARQLVDHPIADRLDQPELLGERDELARAARARRWARASGSALRGRSTVPSVESTIGCQWSTQCFCSTARRSRVVSESRSIASSAPLAYTM